MTALPAGFEPLVNGLGGRIHNRRRRVQFGEGYAQYSPDGVNPKMVEISLDFFIWGEEQLNTMLTFLDNLGAGTITYTLPNESTSHEYELMEPPSVRYVDSQERRLSLELRRVY